MHKMNMHTTLWTNADISVCLTFIVNVDTSDREGVGHLWQWWSSGRILATNDGE